MMEGKFGRYFPDMDALHGAFRSGPCFICRMVAGDVMFPGNLIFEDDEALVFLDGYPRAYGYTLVAPKEHREQVTGDFGVEEYLELQGAWASWGKGVLEISEEEMAGLAGRIGRRL